MLSKWVCLAACALISVCNSAFVDTIKKCSYLDSPCVAELVHSILAEHGEHGIEELNIPPLDPMNIDDLIIPIIGFFNVTMEEGELTGLKDCVISKIHNNFHKGVTKTDLTCDILIKAKFSFDDVSPVVQDFFNQNSLAGDGNVILKLDKLHMQTQIFYDVIRRKEDDDICFKFRLDHITKFDVGNFHMTAKKIYFGLQDVSDFVEKFFNENWKYIMPTFGKGIFDVGMKIVIAVLANFFEVIPAKAYYTDDLTSLVKYEI